MPWAQLLLKVFSVDVMACPKCNSRMQRIAVIQQPSVSAAMLNRLSRKENPPGLHLCTLTARWAGLV